MSQNSNRKSTSGEQGSSLLRLRYRYSPKQFIGDLLAKKWAESILPFVVMVLLILGSGALIPNYFTANSVYSTSHDFADFGFVALAMGLVLVSGGIDLSVGAIFGLANMSALLMVKLLDLDPILAMILTVALGGLLGACNGYLIGYVKTRPFLTTLVSLIVFRAVLNLLDQTFSVDLATAFIDNAVWSFIGDGNVLGVPTNVVLLLIVAAAGHLFLSRSRPGWHIVATGGDRRAALHAGIDIRRTLLMAYILSGGLAAFGGALYAARLDSGTSNAGLGMEIEALTAVVLGGVSLSGGRGTAARAMIGAVIILVLKNTMVRYGVPGDTQSVTLGAVVILAVAADVRWSKNRYKALSSIYVTPALLENKAPSPVERTNGGAFALNDKLVDAVPVGMAETAGPGDVLFDRRGRLYAGTLEGWIMRYSDPPIFRHKEYWCRTGGVPLGMQFDRNGDLIVAVAGRGLFRVGEAADLHELTSATPTHWATLRDDSRIRVPSGVEVGSDGRIWFTEATTKYEVFNWTTDALEGRGNGKLCCYDPATRKTQIVLRDLIFPTGVCLSQDGSCLYVSSSWEATILRYWLSGPRKGSIEPFIEALPVLPGLISRASDGGYWASAYGLRTPCYDLAMRSPDLRGRMVVQLAYDDWIMPNFNVGCVFKFNDAGQVVDAWWDAQGRNHTAISSVREDRGYLYVAGLSSYKIGRKRIPGADPTWSAQGSYWGAADAPADLPMAAE